MCERQKETAWIVFWKKKKNTCEYFVEKIEQIGAAEFVQRGALGEKWMRELFRDFFVLYYEWNSLWECLRKLKQRFKLLLSISCLPHSPFFLKVRLF